VTGSTRSDLVPDLPRIAEAGVPGYVVDGWYGLYAKVGTPKPIVDRMAVETQRAIKSAEARASLRKLGNEAVGSTPDEFRKFLQQEIDKWAKLVKKIELKPLN
jgi:tripartite-type tricarboxylate transporter receptor subunit TctC